MYDDFVIPPSPTAKPATFVDAKGRIIRRGDRWARPFSEGLAVCREGSLDGYIDETGAWVIPPSFKGAGSFSEGKAVVATSPSPGVPSLWGAIDRTGRYVVPPRFKELGSFYCSRAGASLPGSSGVSGFIDETGKWAIQPGRGLVADFSEGLVHVQPLRDGLYGYMNTSGVTVIEPAFLYATPFSDGLAVVEVEPDRWGAIDRSGRLVVPARFEELGPFANGLAPARLPDDDLYGYVDRRGIMRIPPSFYAFARPFVEGVAVVHLKGSGVGYLRPDGTWLTEPVLVSACDFHEGLAAVKERAGPQAFRMGCIDSTGKFVWRADFISPFPTAAQLGR